MNPMMPNDFDAVPTALSNLAANLVSESPLPLISLAILTPLYLVAAIGLWQRKRWAWVLAMVLLAYSMTHDIVSYFQQQPIYFSMALNVIKVGYLNQSEVQLLFGDVLTRDKL